MIVPDIKKIIVFWQYIILFIQNINTFVKSTLIISFHNKYICFSIIGCTYISLFSIQNTKGSELCLFLKNLFIIFPSFYLFIYILSWSQFNGNKKKKLRLWLMIHLIESRPMSVIFFKIICINDVNVFDCGIFFFCISGKIIIRFHQSCPHWLILTKTNLFLYIAILNIVLDIVIVHILTIGRELVFR